MGESGPGQPLEGVLRLSIPYGPPSIALPRPDHSPPASVEAPQQARSRLARGECSRPGSRPARSCAGGRASSGSGPPGAPGSGRSRGRFASSTSRIRAFTTAQGSRCSLAQDDLDPAPGHPAMPAQISDDPPARRPGRRKENTEARRGRTGAAWLRFTGCQSVRRLTTGSGRPGGSFLGSWRPSAAIFHHGLEALDREGERGDIVVVQDARGHQRPAGPRRRDWPGRESARRDSAGSRSNVQPNRSSQRAIHSRRFWCCRRNCSAMIRSRRVAPM